MYIYFKGFGYPHIFGFSVWMLNKPGPTALFVCIWVGLLSQFFNLKFMELIKALYFNNISSTLFCMYITRLSLFVSYVHISCSSYVHQGG